MRPSVLSLPSGPGSIEGLGGAFQADPNTGTASYRIPLKVPPGRNGFQPALDLTYNSGYGNGVCGLGWRINIPCISRQNVRRLPFYTEYPTGDSLDNDHDGQVDEFDEFDTFTYCGAEELVPTTDLTWRLRHESEFLQFKRATNGWTVKRKDGATMTFGSAPVSQVRDAQGRVYSWCLDQMIDTHGNTIAFDYQALDGSAQVYCTTIRFNEGGKMQVTFQYEPRPDILTTFRPRYELRTAYRCSSIQMYEATNLIRSYVLAYAATNDAQPLSLLTSVTQMGADGTSALPPTSLEYTPFNGATAQPVLMTNAPSLSLDDASIQLIDLNGDGLPDILDTRQNPHTYYLNLGLQTNGAIGWSAAQRMTSNINVYLGANTTELADMDGDCRTDLINLFSSTAQIYGINSNLEWQRKPDMTGASFSLSDPTVRLLELSGDRLTDAMRTAGGFSTVWINLRGTNWSQPYTVASPDVSLQFDRPETRLADMNGDRMMDLVYLANGSCYYCPGKGYGEFGPRVTMKNPPTQVTDNTRLFLADVNGDGLADVIHVGSKVRVYLNLGLDPIERTNGRFAPPIEITTSYVNSLVAFRTADMNGNGSVDLVLNTIVGGARRLVYIDLAGDVRPYQLSRIRNGLGQTMSITYRSSVSDMTRDGLLGKKWQNTMAMPVPVVASITTDAGAGPQGVTEYRYHDGYYDAQSEEFRGFGRAETREVGDVGAPDLVANYQFDVGKTNEALKGKLLLTEAGVGPDTSVWPQYDGVDNNSNGVVDDAAELDPAYLFYREQNVWDTRAVAASVPGDTRSVTFACLTNRIRDVFERGGGTPVEIRWEYDYDNYGNRTVQREVGFTNSAPSERRITTTAFSSAYVSGYTNWILDRVVETTIQDATGHPVAKTRHYYDGSLVLGELSKGDPTRSEDWVEGDRYVVSVRKTFDEFGNVSAMYDPLYGTAPGHFRQIQYDDPYHTFPIKESIYTGNDAVPVLETSAVYDSRFGTVTNATDFNSHVTQFGYDTFGRLTSITKPPDAGHTVEYDYVLGYDRGGGKLVNWIETRSHDASSGDGWLHTRTYFDGIGRKLMTKSEAEADPVRGVPRVIVTEASEFNARQKTARVLNPFFSLQGTTLPDLLSYEDIEGPGWQGQFHSEGSLLNLDLASAHSVRTVYDATFRPIQITNPDGTSRQTAYEPSLTRSFDENDTDPSSPNFNTPMVHYRDGLGRLVQVDETVRLNDDGTPSADLRTWSTRYAYDLNDQLTRITDSQNNIKIFSYDGLKRKTDMNDPDRGMMHFVYDDASNLIETTDAKSQRTTYTYDGVNRIRTEKYCDGQPVPPWRSAGEGLTNSVVYHYDAPLPNLPQGDNSLATAQNVKGLLAWVEDLSGEEHTSYDFRGRVESVVKRIPDPVFVATLTPQLSALVSFTTRFAYDSLDRVTNLTYPDADQLRYEYSDRGLLQRIPGGPSGTVVSNIAYQPSSQPAQIDYGNGVRTTYAYDSRLRLKNLLTVSQPSAINAQLINFQYDFDRAANIKSITDQRPGASAPSGDPRRNTQLFQYDDLYRLTRVQYSFSLPGESVRNDGEINYRFDRIGNMLVQTSSLTNHTERGLPVADLGEMDSGGTAGRWNRTGRGSTDPAGPHALTAIRHSGLANRAFPYDPNGNMTVIDGLTNAWDFKDRLVAVENSEMRAAYTYDYTDRRIIKNVAYKPGSANFTNNDSRITTLYVNKYYEVREHDAPTKYVWNGNTRVARVIGSLNTNLRVQRLRVWSGWNLASLAVTAANGVAQLASSVGDSSFQLSAFRWEPSTLSWLSMAPTDTLPAGTVLWIKASTNATLTVTGTYFDPTSRAVPAGGNFLPSAGLEAWDLRSAMSNAPSLAAWSYDASPGCWLASVPTLLGSQSDLPSCIAPGQALFIGGDSSTRIDTSDSAYRLLYYHQDHIGSAMCLSDSTGNPAETTALYPFGGARTQISSLSVSEVHDYGQKEHDAESNLHYFEARYLNANLSRFVSVDPLVATPPSTSLSSPQDVSAYSSCHNNPVKFCDPSGLIADIELSPKGYVYIHIPVRFVGDDATPQNVANAKEAIEQGWSGSFSGHLVQTFVDTEPGRGEANVITLTKATDYVNKAGVKEPTRSYVRGNKEGQWYTGGKDEDFKWTVQHETLHLLGLKDKYEDVNENGQLKSRAMPGYGRNIAGAWGGALDWNKNIMPAINNVESSGGYKNTITDCLRGNDSCTTRGVPQNGNVVAPNGSVLVR